MTLGASVWPGRANDQEDVTLSNEVPYPFEQYEGPSDTRAAELGREIFFDPVLSIDRTVSCASCHQPEKAFADSRPRSPGVNGHETVRNTPTLLNRAWGQLFSWDGQANSLEEQVLLPIENELEMGLPLDEAIARLAEDGRYGAAFEELYGRPVDAQALADTLAAFVRRLHLGDAPVDRFRNGEFSAMSSEERAGFWFYESRGRCWRCHNGPNFSDEQFHNTGIGAVDGTPEPGRSQVTGDEAHAGQFKTPTLRGLVQTAPYMHDGSVATLEEVVQFYRDGGRANSHIDPIMGPLEMSDDDASNLVAFLRSLSRTGDEGSGANESNGSNGAPEDE